MSMASFNQRVSRAINRGNVFDSDIPEYARDAVKTLEQLHSWHHMWTEEEVVLALGASTRTINNLKNCRFIKRKLGNGTYIPLKKITSDQLLRIDNDPLLAPGAFWVTGQDALKTINFDAIAPVAITLRYKYAQFSDYDDSLAWFDLSENLLLAQTILEMGPILKDDKLAQRYGPIAEAKVTVLKDAQSEAEFDGQDNSMIPFADDFEEYLSSGDSDW